ncbi:MAG: stage V sporulation protein AD [Clostridia bacterium]|nr:stage V sporulation protein AD [Clostridia bacterium]
MQKGYIELQKPPVIVSAASVVGKHEYEGPLGEFFDLHDPDGNFGQKTWEQAEAEMQRQAINIALSKAKTDAKNIDALFAGDLINQCICSAQGTLSYDIPFFGLYGACSTIAEGLILSSLLISGGIYESTIAAASSHNSTAERQYRFPLEYGGQRTPTAQWTVTGAGAYVLMSDGNGPHIAGVMPGRSVERGIDDANNMGAAMAPAVIDTLTRYFTQTGTSPSDYDLIATGDLGVEGHGIVSELMKNEGYDMGENYSDCGMLIYDIEKQDMHAGASGCGCSAVVLAASLLERIKCGELSDILFIGTGALMNPMSVQQGQAIPGIAHLVRIKK